MRNILYIDITHENGTFNRSNDITDLQLLCSVSIKMAERHTYEDESNLNNSLLNFNKSEYIPSPKDKLFFLPGTSVPRIKLKNLATTQGIKTTRAIDTANAIFAARTTVNKLTDTTWEYPVSLTNFKKFIENSKEYFYEERDLEKLDVALANYTEPEVIVSWPTWRILTDSDISFNITQGQDENGNDYESNVRYHSITEGKEEICEFLLNNSNVVYDESEILRHVNGADNVTIDGEIYNNLNMMFDSSDTDNHLLAMEIMANSNYSKSVLYLEMLFMNNSRSMDNLREKNHVNFKSLLSYLNKTSSNMNTYIDDVLENLRHRGEFTKENVNTLLVHEAKNQLDLSGSNGLFTIKTISLSPEILAELNHDVTFRFQDDFTPVVEEIPTFDNTTVDDQEELEETPPTMEETYDLVEEQQAEEFGEITEEVKDLDVEEDATEILHSVDNSEELENISDENHQDALDKAAEEGSEEFIEYPEITDEEAEHNIKAQEEIDMIKNDKIIEEREVEELNLDNDGGFDV